MAVNYDLKGKLIAVTGGASGIGRATVEFLASQGAIVAAADRDKDLLAQVDAELHSAGHTITSTVLDITDEVAVEAWISDTVAKFGRPLDGAANIAGIIPPNINVERIEEHNTPDWLSVINVNLTGQFYCLRSQIKNTARGGSIVMMSSIGGVVGLPRNAAYGAAKHAIVGLTRCAATEVGDREMRVNCVAPGIIDTAMQDTARESREGNDEMVAAQKLKRRGKPEEVAHMIAWLLSDQSRFVTGAVHSIDGGWNC